MRDNVGALHPEVKGAEAIEAVLRPSRLGTACIAGACAATLGIVLLTPWPPILQGGLCLGVLAAALEAHRRVAKLLGPGAARGLRLDRRGAIAVIHSTGEPRTGRTQPGSFVAPWLTIVRWRPEGARFDRTIAILPDMLDRETFRRLRVVLRWSASP